MTDLTTALLLNLDNEQRYGCAFLWSTRWENPYLISPFYVAQTSFSISYFQTFENVHHILGQSSTRQERFRRLILRIKL